MSIPPPQLTIWTDASKTGWGGGGNLTGHHGQRRLDPGGEQSPHQHTGVFGCHSISVQPSPSKVFDNPDKNGQYHSRLPHQQAAIEQKQNSVDHPARPSVSLRQHQWSIQARHLPGHLSTWADSRAVSQSEQSGLCLH